MIRLWKRFALGGMIAAMAMTLPGPAVAEGFVNTRNGWRALSAEAKAAYVQGLNDSLNFFYIDDTLIEGLAKRGRTQCLIEQQITAAILSDQITASYEEDQFAQFSPVAVYILKIGELCRPYINRERAAFGLGPQ